MAGMSLGPAWITSWDVTFITWKFWSLRSRFIGSLSHTHTHVCTHAHTHTRSTHAHTHTRTHAHTHTHTHTHTVRVHELQDNTIAYAVELHRRNHNHTLPGSTYTLPTPASVHHGNRWMAQVYTRKHNAQTQDYKELNSQTPIWKG